MAQARLLAPDERHVAARHREDALGLAARLPRLVVAAREVSGSVMHGVHGRRRAGPGEAFWQFRPFVTGEAAAGIDWRRSAREDRTYVREREWEAAHTVYLWVDRSPSMGFVSPLAVAAKLDRALVLGLAAADLLVKGGERVGFAGLVPPMARRTVVEHLAEALLVAARTGRGEDELPPPEPLPPRSRALFIGDWLSDMAAIRRCIEAAAARGAGGHVVLVADPAETTFPYRGHVEFSDSDGPGRLRVGEAESLRAAYLDRLAAHRDALRALCRSRGWSLQLHGTDRPATEAMLGIAAALG